MFGMFRMFITMILLLMIWEHWLSVEFTHVENFRAGLKIHIAPSVTHKISLSLTIHSFQEKDCGAS